MEDDDHFVGLFAQIHLGINFPSLVIRMFFFWCRERNFLTKKNVCPAFRQTGKVRDLHPVFFRYLQLKMINISKWHILGWTVHFRVTPPKRLGGWDIMHQVPGEALISWHFPFCHRPRAEHTPLSKVPKDIIAATKVKPILMGTVRPWRHMNGVSIASAMLLH